jgi:hypothetical protein
LISLKNSPRKADTPKRWTRNYYQAFLELTQPEVEKLAVAVMLDQEKEIRRLANTCAGLDAVERVAKLVRNVFTAISIGLGRFDVFGRLGFVGRVGPEPTVEMDEALNQRFAEIEPIITNTVRRTLPWLLSREVTQGQLPL